MAQNLSKIKSASGDVDANVVPELYNGHAPDTLDAIETGFYTYSTQSTGVPEPNSQSVSGGWILVTSDGENVNQILIDPQTRIAWQRNVTASTKEPLDWESLGFANVTNRALLKTTDLNDVLSPNCVWALNDNSSNPYPNSPADFRGLGFLMVQYGPSQYVNQVIVDTLYGMVWTRQAYESGGQWNYRDWKKVGGLSEEYCSRDEIRSRRLLGVFHSIGVIGDSLASGQGRANSMNESHDFYEYSWPQVIARELGVTVYNFTKSGLTTRTWLTDAKGYPLASDGEHDVQCYIICLGANDISSYSSVGVPLGTSADIDMDNPENNADTYYGNYGKIIQRMKGLEPRAVFFLLTNPSYGDSSKRAQYNAAVAEIAGMFDRCHFVELDESLYASGFIKENLVAGHYTPAGYAYIGEYVMEMISDVVRKNPSEFFYVNLIGTEYADPNQ